MLWVCQRCCGGAVEYILGTVEYTLSVLADCCRDATECCGGLIECCGGVSMGSGVVNVNSRVDSEDKGHIRAIFLGLRSVHSAHALFEC